MKRFIPQIVNFSEYSDSEQFEQGKSLIKQNPNNWEVIDVKSYFENSKTNKSTEEALNEIDSQRDNKDIAKTYIFIEKVNLPTFKTVIIKNEEFVNSEFVGKISVFGSILISKNKNLVVKNKNIGIISKIYEVNSLPDQGSNSLSNRKNDEKFCISFPLLRKDFDIKEIEEIIY